MANLKKLNNPCAIRTSSDRWLGQDMLNNSAFCKFSDMSFGVRACAIIIRNYVTKYRLLSVRDIINRYAPPSDGNDIKSYLDFIMYYTRSLTRGSYILSPSSFIDSDDDLILLIVSISKIESSISLSYDYVFNILKKYDIHLSIHSTPF